MTYKTYFFHSKLPKKIYWTVEKNEYLRNQQQSQKNEQYRRKLFNTFLHITENSGESFSQILHRILRIFTCLTSSRWCWGHAHLRTLTPEVCPLLSGRGLTYAAHAATLRCWMGWKEYVEFIIRFVLYLLLPLDVGQPKAREYASREAHAFSVLPDEFSSNTKQRQNSSVFSKV